MAAPRWEERPKGYLTLKGPRRAEDEITLQTVFEGALIGLGFVLVIALVLLIGEFALFLAS